MEKYYLKIWHPDFYWLPNSEHETKAEAQQAFNDFLQTERSVKPHPKGWVADFQRSTGTTMQLAIYHEGKPLAREEQP